MPAQARQNEYFVPRDGIDREVITSDICRYLGNDALVRPGTYEVGANPRPFDPLFFLSFSVSFGSVANAGLAGTVPRWPCNTRLLHHGISESDISESLTAAPPRWVSVGMTKRALRQ